jgi:glycosyltransferase involved in cell wall biosynthesis
MKFDLCVPAYNEAEIIERTLEQICAELNADHVDWRIIVADNASDDGTAELVESFGHPRASVIRLTDKGKGRAIIAAAQESSAHLFGFIDADLSAHPSDIMTLLMPVMQDEADIVIGSRLLNREMVKRGYLRSASSRIFNRLRRVLLGVNVTDSQCGLKVMNAKARDVLRECNETDWFLDMEFLAKAERTGLSIREVPVHWNEQEYSGRQSKLRIVRDGIGAVNAMIRIRLRLAR